MELALKELQRALKYHSKQLEENHREIQRKLEAIQLLEQSNIEEEETVKQLKTAIEKIKG